MLALVTGANGFTGSYLTRKLLQSGYRVRALVRNPDRQGPLSDLDLDFVYADLADDTPLDDAMAGVDVVFHIAAAYRVENVPQKYFWDVNVNGTRKLLEAAERASIRCFVHSSTVGVQGDISDPPATEEDPYKPGDYYQQSKVEGEKLALDFFEKGRVPVTVVRPVGIYGPGDTRFLKLFKFINNGKFKMIGSGKVLYHLTFVEDLVDGIVMAGENEAALGEVFTIGGEGYLTLAELVTKIAAVLDKPVSRIRIPVAPVWLAGWLCELICKPLGISPPIYRRRVDFFIKDRAFDISKAKSLLGYRPRIDLDTGLHITAEWYKEQGLL